MGSQGVNPGAVSHQSWSRRALGLVAAAATLASAAPATPPEFAGADLALGEKLLREHDCARCHIRRVGADGNAIYRPDGRVNRPSALLSMVERCSVELNLQLFPEDIQAIAAVLQRDHYRFRAAP